MCVLLGALTFVLAAVVLYQNREWIKARLAGLKRGSS
jgi:hypothetical protein